MWVVVVVALAHGRPDHRLLAARGEWLLAVVATEGLAIGAGRLAAAGWGEALHVTGVVLWALGGALYAVIGAGLVERIVRRPLRPGQLTPDWWIVMGAAAIFTLAATSVTSAAAGSVAGTLGVAGWVLASAWIPALAAGEVWQTRTGMPHFTPARWTMVFPLGMYSAASQHLGTAVAASWLATFGRWWLVVAVGAWVATAAGEVHHAFTHGEE
jgi:tellurite resistance protein TehA-like permease